MTSPKCMYLLPFFDVLQCLKPGNLPLFFKPGRKAALSDFSAIAIPLHVPSANTAAFELFVLRMQHYMNITYQLHLAHLGRSPTVSPDRSYRHTAIPFSAPWDHPIFRSSKRLQPLLNLRSTTDHTDHPLYEGLRVLQPSYAKRSVCSVMLRKSTSYYLLSTYGIKPFESFLPLTHPLRVKIEIIRLCSEVPNLPLSMPKAAAKSRR